MHTTDVEWIEGDVLSVDTAALTGEPLPRNYPSEEYGHLILCGATIKAGEAYWLVVIKWQLWLIRLKKRFRYLKCVC